MNRRKFIRNIVSTSILSLGGISAYQYYQQTQLVPPKKDDFNYKFLTENDRVLLEVITPVFLSGMSYQQSVKLNIIFQNIDSAIIRLSMQTQEELRDLFNLLASAFGRLTLANIWLNWQSASSESVDLFLTEWRDSHLDLLQTAYRGLHKLIIGSVYSEEHSWSTIGYAGSPKIKFAQA